MRQKTSKIRKSARNQDCQVRIPGICNFNPETVVLAHLSGGGWGLKRDDHEAAYCCSKCHDALDGRRKTPYSQTELKLMHYDGVMRTQKLLIEQGLIVVK